MARTEKLHDKATAMVADAAARNFKGVNKPRVNNMGLCVEYGAKLAARGICDYFVAAVYGRISISPNSDARNSYTDFGYGFRITAKGEVFTMVAEG